MRPFFQGRNTVIAKPRRAAPNDDITVNHWNESRRVGAFKTAELKDRRESERYGNDGLIEVPLILIPMESQPCAWLVTIDETGVRRKQWKARHMCGV